MTVNFKIKQCMKTEEDIFSLLSISCEIRIIFKSIEKKLNRYCINESKAIYSSLSIFPNE